MDLWIDAQLAPSLAKWSSNTFGIRAMAIRDLGLRDATDHTIFFAARDAGACVMTKDLDFVRLLETHGMPPKILWLTLGNTSNEQLRTVLAKHWHRVRQALDAGEALVEITDD